jgi:two-component system, sensor histidine kinase
VRDSGVGIEAAAQKRVFEEFVQVDNDARDRRRGLGLGLAIARRFMLLMEGDITVRSALGRGCCMALALPKAKPVPKLAEPAAVSYFESQPGALTGEENGAPAQVPALPFKGVLLVEDDPLVAAATREVLESWGLQVRHAATAGQAWRESAFGEVAICDARLPHGASGLDVALRLRDKGKKVMLISGETDAVLREDAQQQGVMLLTKPVSSAQLLASLQRLSMTNFM